MKHYEFPTGKDPAFLFGCGRFRMESNLLENCADEILRFGRHPLFVCDDNSHAVAFDKVAASLHSAGVELRELRHNGFCCRDDALAYAESGALAGVDVVLGCGGGVICDFSKCLAHLAGTPLVTIPTSSAQCCAYTPIAVCYTRDGRYVSTSHFPGEIAVALLDTTVLSRQPSRLLAAGALDAMAKKIELEFWTQLDAFPHGVLPPELRATPLSEGGETEGALCAIPLSEGGDRTQAMPPSERGVAPQGPGGVLRAAPSGPTAPSGIASAISDFIYADLDAKVDAAMVDLANGEPTPILRDVFFDSIVGAGIVSGIAGGSRQVALAHRFYFFARQRVPETGRRFTHGELVAVGLVMQHAYNGKPDAAAALAARLRGWGLAASVAELGLPIGPGELDACADFIGATKTMKAAVAVDPSAPSRLRDALRAIYP